MKIVADQHIPFVEDYFAHAGELHLLPGRQMSTHALQDADLLLVRSVTRVDQSLLQNSNVKFVGSVTAGADHLDLNWLRNAGIEVSLASGFNAPPVADYVVSVIAALQSLDRLSAAPLTVGVIGAGHVGRRVIEKLSILNHDIIISDPLRAEQEPDFVSHGLEEFVDLDLISLHVPLTHDHHPTNHFINDVFLKRQKPGCVLINASRGAVIDSSALLNSGRHLVWCFDVWENEPHIYPEILAESRIATPHIAGYSLQAKRRGIEMIYQAACNLGFIPQIKNSKQLQMPQFSIDAAGQRMTWQSLVLSLFNPLQMTDTMKRLLLESSLDHARLFDELRLNFNRHELAYVTLSNALLNTKDAEVLQQFGVKMNDRT